MSLIQAASLQGTSPDKIHSIKYPGLATRADAGGSSTVSVLLVTPLVLRKMTRCIMFVLCVTAVGGMMLAAVTGALCR